MRQHGRVRGFGDTGDRHIEGNDRIEYFNLLKVLPGYFVAGIRIPSG